LDPMLAVSASKNQMVSASKKAVSNMNKNCIYKIKFYWNYY